MEEDRAATAAKSGDTSVLDSAMQRHNISTVCGLQRGQRAKRSHVLGRVAVGEQVHINVQRRPYVGDVQVRKVTEHLGVTATSGSSVYGRKPSPPATRWVLNHCVALQRRSIQPCGSGASGDAASASERRSGCPYTTCAPGAVGVPSLTDGECDHKVVVGLDIIGDVRD
jgi:hypothetical protein